MSWASSRQFLIVSIVLFIVLIIAGLIAYPFIFKAPSCVDGKQNQTETGIDCGGTCGLCTESLKPPQAFLARAIEQQGRIDVIAYIDNPNVGASIENVSYTVELYSEDNTTLLTSQVGKIDLAPKRTPLFLPNFYDGTTPAGRVFMSFDTSKSKFKNASVSPVLLVTDVVVQESDTNPRVTATLENDSSATFRNTKVVIAVYDKDNNVIGASQTIVPSIAPRGRASLLFTWNTGFVGVPTRQEILPVYIP